MRWSAGLLALVVCCSWTAAQDAGGDKPSPIPAKLEKQAKKTFADKKLFFIWAEQPTPKFTDLRLKYAVNPNLKEEAAHRVVKLTRRVPTGQQVPFTLTEPGITKPFTIDQKFRGRGSIRIYLIKEADVITPQGLNPSPEKVPPRSNVLSAKVSFD